MDLWTAARTIGRQWRVLVLGLIVTGLIVAVVASSVQQRYSATGTAIVIAPGGTANPIDIYSSSSSLAASVAATLGTDDSTKAAVVAAGGAPDYTLVPDPSLPTITVTATSGDPMVAVRSFNVLMLQMNKLLADRQRQFVSPTSSHLQVLAVTTPTTAKVTSYKLTVLGVAGGLGVLLAISQTFVAESAAERRRRRRAQELARSLVPRIAPVGGRWPAIGWRTAKLVGRDERAELEARRARGRTATFDQPRAVENPPASEARTDLLGAGSAWRERADGFPSPRRPPLDG